MIVVFTSRRTDKEICGKTCRSRAISGPDSRLAPWNESAMSRALRQAKEQGGICIFYPSEGTTFNSCEEAKDFYNLYSWEVGFGIRYGKSRKNSNGYRTKQELVCSCEVIITAKHQPLYVLNNIIAKLCKCIPNSSLNMFKFKIKTYV